jgi:hypothetical protein
VCECGELSSCCRCKGVEVSEGDLVSEPACTEAEVVTGVFA